MSDWQTIAAVIGSALSSGAMVMYLAKLLIGRSLEKQDTMADMLSEMRVDLAVIKRDISHALELRSDVKADHDKIIVLEQKAEKAKEDLNEAWKKVRSIATGH